MKDEPGYGTMLASMLLASTDVVAAPTFVPRFTRDWTVNDLSTFKRELDDWLHESWDTSITVREWWRRVADAGLAMPTWPKSFHGIGAPTAIQQLVERQFAAAGVIGPPIGGVGLRLVGTALRQHGTPDQCDHLLMPVLRGEQSWCLLVHEHDADLADIETAAIGDTTTYSITGSKLWSADVPTAQWGFVVARTDRAAHIKRALTCFAVDLDHPGVTASAADAKPHVVRLDGVPARRVDAIGGVGSGWAVAQTIVAHAQTTLAGRIRRGVVDVAPGEAAGNLDRVVADVLADHRPRPRRSKRRDEPGSDRRHSADFT